MKHKTCKTLHGEISAELTGMNSFFSLDVAILCDML